MKLVLLSVVNIALNACILYYLQNLERIGCICAMNYKRDYIYAYTIFSICFDIINAGTQGKISKYLEDKKSGIYIALILLLAGIINLVFTFQYILDIKKDNCNCSESVFREMMFALAIIRTCVIGVMIISAVSAGYLFYTLLHSIRSTKLKKK